MHSQRSLTNRILALAALGVMALVLTMLAGGIWSALLVANLTTSPAIPWSVVAMGLLLWIVWRYLGGRWGPASTSEWRRRSLRANPVTGRVFAAALLAGGLSIAALAGFWIVLFQLVEMPGNFLPDFSIYPRPTVVLALGMAALVGAVVEEAGFRGYLQGALEKEVGGPAAIVIAALVIAPGHASTQGFVWPTLLFYLCVDVMFGVTARLTDSTLPGIAIHFIGLLVFFNLVWPNDATRRLSGAGGADHWFWIHVGQACLCGALAVLAFRHVATLAERERGKRAASDVLPY
jgi:membrane protease YdiL (CAAX protease family)